MGNRHVKFCFKILSRFGKIIRKPQGVKFFGAPCIFVLNCLADISDHVDVLRRTYAEVTHTIEAQSVARNMFQCNALTPKELQSIQSQRFEPIKAAEQLVNIVTNQSDNVFTWFLDALKKTDQRHVYEIVVTGSYSGTNNSTYYKRPVTYLVFRLN